MTSAYLLLKMLNHIYTEKNWCESTKILKKISQSVSSKKSFHGNTMFSREDPFLVASYSAQL